MIVRGVVALLTASLASACSPPGLLSALDGFMPGHGGSRVAAGVPFGAQGQQLDVWRNGEKRRSAPVMIFYYGGGWVKGGREEYGFAARAFASRGFIVVLPDYRKVPQVRFPAFVQDAADAVKWTRDHIADYGGDPERIAVSGHSAGAYAVAMLALDRKWLARAGVPDGTIKAAVGLSGPYDFIPFTGRAIEAMGRWPRPAETQPISFVRRDAPPMMLITGSADDEVRPKNSRNLAARLKTIGAPVIEKEYAGQGHEDIAMALSLPFRNKAAVLDDSVAFVMRAMVTKPVPSR